MPGASLHGKRFVELAEQVDAIEAAKKFERTEMFSGHQINTTDFLNWRVKARNLLQAACGADSEHYRQFISEENSQGFMTTTHDRLVAVRAVFSAAKEDFEGGYLNTLRNLVQAEVFSNELDQARELNSSGYYSAAAVIAGVVLETTLRQLCTDRSIPTGKLDKMNADLAKAGAYNSLVQKRITALAGIRNSAAHGKPNEFTPNDVADMIPYIENFVAQHL